MIRGGQRMMHNIRTVQSLARSARRLDRVNGGAEPRGRAHARRRQLALYSPPEIDGLGTVDRFRGQRARGASGHQARRYRRRR